MQLVNARICTQDDDVMLVTASGRAIRFRATDVRVFKGRDSSGVRGIRLNDKDTLVSMSIIRHFEATPDETGEDFQLQTWFQFLNRTG